MTARFAGTDSYVATEDLMMAVNAAVTLGRPLLVKGEPGSTLAAAPAVSLAHQVHDQGAAGSL
jgi:MoxR-like ATPase